MNTPNIRALALARLLRCACRPAGEQPSSICHSCEYSLVEWVDDYPDIPIPPDCFIDGRGAWVSCDFERLAKDAAETLEYLGGDEAQTERLAKDIDVLIKENAKLRKELDAAPQWVSVKERKPEIPCVVLWGAYGNIDYARGILTVSLGGKDLHFVDKIIDLGELYSKKRLDCLNEGNAITHWMPLPEPPIEAQHD